MEEEKTAGVVVLQRQCSNKLFSYASNYAAANVLGVANYKQLMEMRRNCREKVNSEWGGATIDNEET